jgi:hypothetical protein
MRRESVKKGLAAYKVAGGSESERSPPMNRDEASGSAKNSVADVKKAIQHQVLGLPGDKSSVLSLQSRMEVRKFEATAKSFEREVVIFGTSVAVGKQAQFCRQQGLLTSLTTRLKGEERRPDARSTHIQLEGLRSYMFIQNNDICVPWQGRKSLRLRASRLGRHGRRSKSDDATRTKKEAASYITVMDYVTLLWL